MNSLSRFSKDESGFTLLEMLIVVGILLMLTGLISEVQVSIFKRRDEISQEGAFYNSIRFSLNLIQRDIAHLYSPTLMLPPKKKASADPNNPGTPGALPPSNVFDPSDTSNRITTYWGAAKDATGVRPSRFQGTESSLSFVASSHIVIYKNKQECEFAKIQYELKQDELKDPDGNRGQMLARTENPNVFDDEERRERGIGVTRYSLIHGIKAFRFKYWNNEQRRWESKWDSESEEFRGKYPEMIQVELEVRGGKKLSFQGDFIYRPEIPLNGIGTTL